MNLSYRPVRVISYAIYIYIIIVYISVCHIVRSSQHIRHKRVFGGTVAEEGKFPYIVFLKAVVHPEPITAPLRCSEKICTGTLIHTRFVLTITSCVQLNKYDVNATDIKVSKTNNFNSYLPRFINVCWQYNYYCKIFHW